MMLSLPTTPQTDKRLHLQDLALARVASLVAITAGLLDEVGWALQIPALTQIGSGFPTMKPLEAACFILVGTAVLLLNNPRIQAGKILNKSRAILFVVSGLAIVVLLICGADGANGLGVAYTFGEFTVCNCFAIRDLLEVLPNFFLKFGPLH